MGIKTIDIELRPMEIMRVKNVIRGNALEKDIRIKFGDEMEGSSAIPCSTSTGNINLHVLIKEEEGKQKEIEDFITWLNDKWK